MDKKVFRMALLTIISALILILVIVYATNADRINALLGLKEKNAGDATAATSGAASVSITYGEQIGDNLNGFLYDDEFFDETESIPSVVVIKKNVDDSEDGDSSSSASSASSEEGGTGMAVQGQVVNPDAYDTTGMPAPTGESGTPVGTH